MRQAYGFTLPNEQKLVDREGLIEYLHRKVQGGICIYCGRVHRTVASVKDHMCGKGHQRIRYLDNEEEYNGFYEHSEHQRAPMDAENGFRSADGRMVKGRDDKRPTSTCFCQTQGPYQ